MVPNHTSILLLWQLRGFRHNDTSIVMKTTSTQILVSNTLFNERIRTLGQRTDS